MNGTIPTPAKGEPPRASWAAAVTDVCNAVRVAGLGGTLARDGAGAFGNEPLPANQRNRRASLLPRPYEVRWDASLEDGKGGWAIYLPNEHLLQVGSDFVVPTGATAIPDTDGWMALDEVGKDADHVWLNVTFNQTGPSSAALEAEDKTNATANIVGICIAEVSYEDDTESASVSQSVVGALVMTSASGESGNEDAGHHLDERSINNNTDEKHQVYGFEDAEEGSIPQKQNGVIVWLTPEDMNPDDQSIKLMAGSGIRITKNAAGVYTISATGNGDGQSASGQDIEVIEGIRYDEDTHKLIAVKRKIRILSAAEDSHDAEIFTAVSHRSEHE